MEEWRESMAWKGQHSKHPNSPHIDIKQMYRLNIIPVQTASGIFCNIENLRIYTKDK